MKVRFGKGTSKCERGEERGIVFEIDAIHHVSLPVTDLEHSRAFYEEVLGLTEIERPQSDSPGAWYRLGKSQLHLIAGDNPTIRKGKEVDPQDMHVALRVNSYSEMREFLRSKGFDPEAGDEFKKVTESPSDISNWPRLHIMDPDRNIIELIAE
jgi:catechol 2,3-dioxygenase-like lactoylglutathione lyase family enzyme